jgi:hypothetical protein
MSRSKATKRMREKLRVEAARLGLTYSDFVNSRKLHHKFDVTRQQIGEAERKLCELQRQRSEMAANRQQEIDEMAKKAGQAMDEQQQQAQPRESDPKAASKEPGEAKPVAEQGPASIVRVMNGWEFRLATDDEAGAKESRVTATELARELGYSDKEGLLRLADRNKHELARLGVTVTVTVTGKVGATTRSWVEPSWGRLQTQYLIDHSETDIARDACVRFLLAVDKLIQFYQQAGPALKEALAAKDRALAREAQHADTMARALEEMTQQSRSADERYIIGVRRMRRSGGHRWEELAAAAAHAGLGLDAAHLFDSARSTHQERKLYDLAVSLGWSGGVPRSEPNKPTHPEQVRVVNPTNGRNFAILRRHHKTSQRELADYTEIPSWRISAFESGDIEVVRDEYDAMYAALTAAECPHTYKVRRNQQRAAKPNSSTETR